jgi:hypothetical protein
LGFIAKAPGNLRVGAGALVLTVESARQTHSK